MQALYDILHNITGGISKFLGFLWWSGSKIFKVVFRSWASVLLYSFSAIFAAFWFLGKLAAFIWEQYEIVNTAANTGLDTATAMSNTGSTVGDVYAALSFANYGLPLTETVNCSIALLSLHTGFFIYRFVKDILKSSPV